MWEVLLQEGQMEMPNYEMWVSEIRLKAQKSEIRLKAQKSEIRPKAQTLEIRFKAYGGCGKCFCKKGKWKCQIMS